VLTQGLSFEKGDLPVGMQNIAFIRLFYRKTCRDLIFFGELLDNNS
jgi:hypothetical protein